MNIKERKAFIIGIALGDGNLSNPNGRAVRLRITCDTKYPNLIKEIIINLKVLFPNNKVAKVRRKDNCADISLYSNKLEELLPWKAGKGTKYDQKARIPDWIFTKHIYCRTCLRGLILTDGSIYTDRGYTMTNVSTNILPLAEDIVRLGKELDFRATLTSTPQPSGRPKYTVRFAKDTEKLLKALKLKQKS